MTEQADPRAQYRQLPEPVQPEELVETEDPDLPRVVETPPEVYLRIIAGGGAG